MTRITTWRTTADDGGQRRQHTTTRQRPKPKIYLARRFPPSPALAPAAPSDPTKMFYEWIFLTPPLHPQPQRASQARQARHPIDGIMGAACRWWLTPAPLRSRTRCRSHDDLRVPSRRNVGSGCRRLAGCPTHQATSNAGGRGGGGCDAVCCVVCGGVPRQPALVP